ncbi:hypothetical protein FZEAL_3635 [Fusarium zealandicum]|uniref:Uncharacterized protein n=1 Tax=Fusarium zealandicum TaxID=1053134 RepID=A0A8H4XMQ8_9HYPO|nr:hypothetical protein FZEAL_3635 [Fusarium zealandicum]
MLRRNSSRRKNRRPLSRSKSTNSVVRSPVHAFEFIDPVTAERDANIAALLSYHRSHGRSSGEMVPIPRDPASFFPDQSDGTASWARQSLERSDSVTTPQGRSNVSRQQSVRFAGPSARPRRTLASRASESRDSPAKMTLRTHGSANTRPPSTVSFHGDKNANYSLTQRYLESLQPPDGCYNPEDDAISMPSSFRKLRKSKSMLTSHPTTGHLANIPAKGRLPPTDALFKIANNENEHPKEPPRSTGLRASTSMSFLKNRRRIPASRSSSRTENDLAVQLAREKIRQQAEDGERLKPQPSRLFRVNNRRSEGSSGLRKSLRNSSNTSTALSSTFSTNSVSLPKQPGLRKTARKVSNTLRSKLKGLFTRRKSSTGSERREEQDADAHESEGESCLHFDMDEANEEASMFHVTSHVPSLHDVPLSQQLRSRKGSVESLEIGDQQISDDKSRVTSWTDSVTNTVSSQCMLGEWERQRLSVIKENGTHIPSSSLQPGSEGQRMLPRTAIDSERVYKALVKKLGEGSPKKHRTDITSDVAAERTSSRLQTEAQQWASTIRCVRPDDDVFRDHDYSSITSSSSTELPNVPEAPHETAASLAASDVHEESCRGSVISGFEAPRATSHRSSAFFASPTCHSFRSPSPYRRALRESTKTTPEREQGLPGSRYLHSLSALSLPTRRNSSTGSEGDVRVGDAESVYSCTAEDVKPAGSISVAAERPAHDALASYRPNRQHQRDASTASSVEWKMWLSSKVSKLESPMTPTKVDANRQGSGTLPPLGHLREGADMGSTPERFVRTGEATDRSPLSCVKGNAQPVNKTSEQLLRRAHAGHDENASPNASGLYLKGRPPSIPPRSTLRTVPSLPTVSLRCEPKAGTSEVHRMRSLNTMGRLNSTPEEAIVKRRSRTRLTAWQGSPVKSSPGVGAMPEIQSANASPAQKSAQSTPRMHLGWERKGKPAGKGAMGSGLDAQAMGSKTMVDMFLNSRRKRADGGSGIRSSPSAFL